jgi:hypothetical protein
MAKVRSLICAVFLGFGFGFLPGCVVDPAAGKKADNDAPPKKAIADDTLARQARLLRANSSNETGTGLSDKSRSIENDLGLQ